MKRMAVSLLMVVLAMQATPGISPAPTTLRAAPAAGKEAMVRHPFVVQPDTIYRLHLRVRRGRTLTGQVLIVEEQTGARHALGLTSNRPLSPTWQEYEAWFATTPAATEATLLAQAARAADSDDGALEVQIIEMACHAPVDHFPTPSANYVFNGDAEQTDEAGVVSGFERWSAPHDAKAVAGAGLEGSRGIVITEGYHLVCATVPALLHHRYRFTCFVRGQGRVSLEMRSSTAAHGRLDQGTVFQSVELDDGEWQRLELKTVALPGSARLTAVIHAYPGNAATIAVDRVRLIVE